MEILLIKKQIGLKNAPFYIALFCTWDTASGSVALSKLLLFSVGHLD